MFFLRPAKSTEPGLTASQTCRRAVKNLRKSELNLNHNLKKKRNPVTRVYYAPANIQGGKITGNEVGKHWKLTNHK